MNVIIVDDERHARENLQHKIDQIPSVMVVAKFDDPAAACVYLKTNHVDVAFLDIEMYELTGIEIAKKIKDEQPKTNIIFVTGHTQYMQQAFSLHASGYLLKPASVEAILEELEHLRYPIELDTKKGVFVQTFGHFEVFLDGTPLAFTLSKAKELFAFLIDRKGSAVKTAEIAATLWEDRVYDRYLQNQTQKIIASMMRTLRDAGIEDVIVKKRNQRAIDRTKLQCDYYRMLDGDVRAVNAYHGQYMLNYSWAEMTAGALARMSTGF